MSTVRISELPSGVANGAAIVPATNAAGTLTEKVTLASVASLVKSANQLTEGTLADARLSPNVVLTTDPRLSDARAPLSHSHSIANVTDLQSQLDGKASASHQHAIADVTNLQSTLNGKVGSSTSQAGGGTAVTNIVTLTQAQYDAIPSKDTSTIYFVQ